MAEKGSLSAKQQQLVLALAQGLSVSDAAERCQVAERTAYRWAALPEVKEALEQAQNEMFDESLRMLRLGVKTAMATLLKHMKAEVEPTAATQLQSAKEWLSQAITTQKVEALERQVKELQQLIGDRQV